MITIGLNGNLRSNMAINKIIDLEAWSDGQAKSKAWLICLLEKYIDGNFNTPPTIWQLAGWYALPANMLFVRGNVNIDKYRSFDISPEAEVIAEAINNTWLIDKWKFKAITQDINEIDYNSPWCYHSPSPDIIINTSCEHIEQDAWFRNIPAGKFVILQSTNMKHSDHYSRVDAVTELKKKYNLSDYLFADELEIKYETWSFKRFMTIGIK